MEIFKLISEQPWISGAIGTSAIALITSIIGIAIGVLNNKKTREYLSDLRKLKKIPETVESQGKQIRSFSSDINRLKQQIITLNDELKQCKEKNISLHTKVVDLSSQLDYFYSANRGHSNQPKSIDFNDHEIEQAEEQIDQVQTILEQYTKLNIDYFNHPHFIPVELTEESKDNRQAINGEPIVEFRTTTDKASAIYLIFQFNNQFYLIPNATIPKISRLIKLNNDSRIFEMNTVSDRFELKSPACLELIKENHWKLTSRGSFGDR